MMSLIVLNCIVLHRLESRHADLDQSYYTESMYISPFLSIYLSISINQYVYLSIFLCISINQYVFLSVMFNILNLPCHVIVVFILHYS